MLKRLPLALTLSAAALLLLAGCVAPSSETDTSKPGDTSSSEADEEEETVAPPAEGEVAAPGTTVGMDTWLTYTYLNTDKEEALISARLLSIEPATEEQTAFVREAFDEGQVDDFDIWLVIFEEKKESGASVDFEADYTFFDVVDADKDPVQEITLIGWDGCESNFFTTEFETDGAVLPQCLLAASKGGGAEPVGLAFTGGYEDGNPYSSFDGKPLYFMK